MTSVVVAGALAAKPGNGGEAWVRLSYILGLQKLGFTTRLVEQIESPSPAAVAYFREVADAFGIDASLIDCAGTPFVGDPFDGADLLLNISGNLRAPGLRSRFRRTVFVDLDPGFTQVWHVRGVERVPRHDVYLTVGANVGSAFCSIPTGDIEWRATRPPVVLDRWHGQDVVFDRFTTVASWRCAYGPIEPYGLKHHAWRRLAQLPRVAGLPFEAVVGIDPSDDADRRTLEEGDWRLLDPAVVAAPQGFEDYVRASGAEFSVAQGIYVDTKSGWFSDRSVRYLAAGRPVLVEDTGFGRTLPIGEGLLAFRGLDDAAAKAHAIVEDYEHHAHAARALAEEHFDSAKVLATLLEDAL
jgi:hypothetical protein